MGGEEGEFIQEAGHQILASFSKNNLSFRNSLLCRTNILLTSTLPQDWTIWILALCRLHLK
jgi:hypothetical protein